MANKLQIGKIALRSRVLVAPMSGVTDLPFRRILSRFHPGAVFSEMVAGEGLSKEDPENVARAAGAADIKPMAVQLVGRDPDWMAQGARKLEASGAEIIDINFGCPARKVVNGLSGSALMKEPDLAKQIVAAVSDAVSVPVTVKMRLGWDDDSHNATEIAQDAIEVGAAAVTVHGRTRCQFYKGTADWAAIKPTFDQIDVPTFVNGDVRDAETAITAIQRSGADGVMVGRALIGRPWALIDILKAVDGVTSVTMPDAKQKSEIALDHYAEILGFYPERKAVRVARKHLVGYADEAGMSSDAPKRKLMLSSDNPADVQRALTSLFADQLRDAA